MSFFKVLVLLGWILYGMGVLVYAVLAEDYDRILILKEPVSDKALQGHVIRTEKAADEGSCRVKCYLEPNCVSVNFGPAEKGRLVCELNNATDESPTLSKLAEKKGYTYNGVENPCHSHPCPVKRDVCQVGFTEKGFRCVCREGYKEKQCGQDCQKGFGMEKGEISDAQITASSQWDANHAPRQGRLHFKANGKIRGAWSAKHNDANQWLQIYLGCEPVIITGLATQGRNRWNKGQWVTGYSLQYSDDTVNFMYYREPGKTDKKYFSGNTDSDTVVYHDLSRPITARFIRFRPVKWNNHISMRVEVYGCSKVCPSYWKTFESSMYAVFSIKRTWKQAKAFCKAMDARLVKIDSENESHFINTIAPTVNQKSEHYWIGLTDADMEEHWKWSDGSPVGPYTNWNAGEPNNLAVEEDCGALVIGRWYDYPCWWEIKFICEK